MKVLAIFFAAVIAISSGKPTVNEIQVYEPKKLGIELNELASEATLEELLEALKKFVEDGDISGIFNVELDPLLDDLLENLKTLIIRGGMDPLELEDQTLQLGLGIVGKIQLTSGWLQDISTIARNGDVIVSYNSSSKKVTFTLPLSFKVLLFTYKYVTRVTLLTINGDVQGKIDDVHMNLQITYDPSIHGFVLDNLDMSESGKVTVEFTGNDLVDWITNAMTSVITTVLHPLIVSILGSNVKSVGNEIVDAVNEYINNSTLLQI